MGQAQRDYERERLVADAILLERAAKALDRRKHGSAALVSRLNDDSLAFSLRVRAHRLRQEAEANA